MGGIRAACAVIGVNLLLVAAGFCGNIEIETPEAGWRNSAKEKLKFTQQVQYPASAVNTQENQSRSALIRGKVARAGKKESPAEPYLLIVNGVAMPLAIAGDSFSRPYLFGVGSNSVEIRGPDKTERSRLQFYEANTSMLQPKLSILLAWDTDQTDLDLHVVSPDGKHCWYGERVMDNGGALDVDVTTGYGPEIFATPNPLKGTYLVYVNYFGSGPRNDLTVAQVTVITHQNTADEKKETLVVPMRKPGELTLVHSFVVP